MAPKVTSNGGTVSEQSESTMPSYAPVAYQMKLKWMNIFLLSTLHVLALYGLYLSLFHAKTQTMFFYYVIGIFGGLGITAGAHRLWSHRAYKARVPLRIFLMLLNALSLQNDIYAWSRDHRMHHKFSETDADPHNSNRGFFFSHVGWLMCKKHPELVRKGKTLDCSDLLKDPVVVFQRKYYAPLVLLMCFTVPTVIPVWGWGESILNALFVCGFYRYCYTLHCTWFVNSVAHVYGMKQYDKSIMPSETAFVSYCTYGEGYHNYHHVFPYDYSASELGWKYNFNFTTLFIDSCAKLGLAYELRKVPRTMVESRVQRTGESEQHKLVVKQAKTNILTNRLMQIVCATSHLWVPLLIRQYTMST